jgi:hypothetical protein
MELTTVSEGLPLALVNTNQLWADARTDASSSRRKDMIRDKTGSVGALFSVGKGNCRSNIVARPAGGIMNQKRLNCAQCEAPLPKYKGRGKPRRYCSDACEAAAHQQGNTSRSPGKDQKQCQHCRRMFTGEGEYCGDACYYLANKHNCPSAGWP